MFGVDFSGLETIGHRLGAFNPVPSAEAEIQRGIRARTARGVDADGQSLSPYRRRTVVFREKKGLRVDKVNLRVKTEESLLDLMSATTESGGSTIGFPESKAGQVEGLVTGKRKYGSQAPRHFVGVGSEDIRSTEIDLIREFERMFS